MSYLVYCTKHKPAAGAEMSSAHYFKVKWRGVTGMVCVNPLGGVILYKRHSALGKLLSRDDESQRHYVRLAIQATPMVEDGVNWDRSYTWFHHG